MGRNLRNKMDSTLCWAYSMVNTSGVLCKFAKEVGMI